MPSQGVELYRKRFRGFKGNDNTSWSLEQGPAQLTSHLGIEREHQILAKKNFPSILHPEMVLFLGSSKVAEICGCRKYLQGREI